jgi:hypothetical protein
MGHTLRKVERGDVGLQILLALCHLVRKMYKNLTHERRFRTTNRRQRRRWYR